jgi:hypothetical protein
MVHAGEDTQEVAAEAQQLSQNNGNNDGHDNENDDRDNNDDHEEEEEDNEVEEEDDEYYTPMSNFRKEEMSHEAEEIKTSGNDAPILIGRLRELLNRINITTPPKFKIKRVPRPGREEYRAIVEIFNGPNLISRHMEPAFRATYRDAVADAAWQAITTYNRSHHDKLKNSVYYLLPQRKKSKFKTFGIMVDVSRMLMVHHQDVSMEMSIHLQAAQQLIQSLRNQLRDSNVTIRGYQRMIAGEASDLYASDTYT